MQHVQGPAGRAYAALLQLMRDYLDVERSFAGADRHSRALLCPQLSLAFHFMFSCAVNQWVVVVYGWSSVCQCSFLFFLGLVV